MMKKKNDAGVMSVLDTTQTTNARVMNEPGDDKTDESVFFFSSRRRHTIWPRDWSSDVCSSDLEGWPAVARDRLQEVPGPARLRARHDRDDGFFRLLPDQIGRASCRERV